MVFSYVYFSFLQPAVSDIPARAALWPPQGTVMGQTDRDPLHVAFTARWGDIAGEPAAAGSVLAREGSHRYEFTEHRVSIEQLPAAMPGCPGGAPTNTRVLCSAGTSSRLCRGWTPGSTAAWCGTEWGLACRGGRRFKSHVRVHRTVSVVSSSWGCSSESLSASQGLRFYLGFCLA